MKKYIKKIIRSKKDEVKDYLMKSKYAKDVQTVIKFTEWFNYNSNDLKSSLDILEKNEPFSKEKTINWLVPNFHHPYGGVFTIFRIADYLESKGYKNKLIIYDNPEFKIGDRINTINKHFPNIKDESIFALRNGIDGIPESDICIATLWTSCYQLLKIKNTKRKAYLIQDFEPGFYTADTTYSIVEDTYRFPFHRIFNTSGLQKYVDTNYPSSLVKSMSFTPAADERYIYNPKKLEYPIKILFYGRPSTPRNAFELSLGFVKKVKEKYGDKVQFVSAGENYNLKKLGLQEYETYITNVGIIAYNDLPKFYSQFHFIISFMLTKHPSYIPFEAMASGSLVIANFNEANTWFLEDKVNSIFARPSVDMLMESFEEVLNSPELYKRIIENANDKVKKVSWKSEMKSIYNFLEEIG